MKAETKYNRDGSIQRIIELSNGDFAVDLFPYKIKNRELFYDRDHPENIAPESFEYESYWEERLKNYLEGRWVNDEGTWVYMPPKLDFFINYVPIVDENRRKIMPRLRDNEWIMSYYGLCAEGFSGFELDEEYTCNELVQKWEEYQKDNKKELKGYELSQLEASPYVKTKTGEYKKYINAWEYLTEHYLLTHKKDFPLGKAIYENNKYDEMILASRTIGKSFYSFGGNLLHEWLSNGTKNIEDFKKFGSNQKLFGAGAVKADQLDRSLAIIKRMYNDMPGSYSYGVDDKGKEDKVNGFMYKRIIGSWESGSKVEHKVENINNTIDISGNILQAPVLTPDNFKIFAGDRFAMILIEEVGFVPFLKKLRNAFRDSLGVGKKKIGKAIYTGTGGDMEAIQDAKEMFESPDAFSIYPIPNYFDKNRHGKIGLFLSVCLKAEEFKDKNGNTLYEAALLDVVEQREIEYEKSDSSTFWEFIAFNPLYPREMLRPSSKSVLPVVEMSEHRGDMIVRDIWKNRSSIGGLRWDMNEPSRVAYKRDFDDTFYIINDWGKDKELHNREGGWVIYEDVMPQRPDHLYYILYDPAAHTGEGTSLHSALVYKHKFTGGNKSLQETFVAEFIGRKPTLEQNFEEVIKAALYYNAKILPEANTPGFYEWCERKGWGHLVMYEPQRFLSEVRRTPQKFSHRRGIRVDDVINKWSLTRFGDWLRQPVMIDDDGIPLKFRYQNIYSLRLLDEAINFTLDRKTEFDHMSSAMLLMPLLLEIEEDSVEVYDEFTDPLLNKYAKQSVIDYKPKGRSRFINY